MTGLGAPRPGNRGGLPTVLTHMRLYRYLPVLLAVLALLALVSGCGGNGGGGY